MPVGNSHFKFTMTGGTKSDQIGKYICVILISVISSGFNMMNVKVSSAWATLCSARLAYPIPVIYQRSYSPPSSSKLEALPPFPVGTSFPNQVVPATVLTTISSPISKSTGESGEYLITVGAGRYCPFSKGNVDTGLGTVDPVLRGNGLPTYRAGACIFPVINNLLFYPPRPMAFRGTESKFCFLYLTGGSCKRLFTSCTNDHHRLTQSFPRTYLGTVVYFFVVGLKLFPALEAYLGH